jgi:NAD(P)-dependent dehydrogenase (short-subunit alcohol dehydrogenase family)
MNDVRGKAAFITGGASGIGLGMARAFLQAGMRVVIADASRPNLDDAVHQLRDTAGDYRCVQLDVTDRVAMARTADEVERESGRIHVLCNNAGIGTAPSVRTATYADWDRMLGVNLMGVINGIVTFLPRIRAHGEGGHIVNTASMAGIIPLPDPGCIYSTTKFAVRGLSESLRLALAQDRIGVSVLCPGLTLTRILDEARKATQEAGIDELSAGFVHAQKFAMDPRAVGVAVLDAIRRNDPYVLPHAEFIDEVRSLHTEIIAAFRTDLPVNPGRAAFENVRRRLIDDIKASLGNL